MAVLAILVEVLPAGGWWGLCLALTIGTAAWAAAAFWDGAFNGSFLRRHVPERPFFPGRAASLLFLFPRCSQSPASLAWGEGRGREGWWEELRKEEGEGGKEEGYGSGRRTCEGKDKGFTVKV